MGQAKNEQIQQKDAEDKAWEQVAKEKDWRCERCGNLIFKDEKDGFFDTKICSVCQQATRK